MPSTLKIGPYTVPGCTFQWDNPAATLAYAASTTLDLALPRDGLVTDVIAFADPFEYDNTGTLTPNEDMYFKGIASLKLMADGGRNYWQFTDARGLHYFNLADYGDSLQPGNPTTANGTNNINRTAALVFHPGLYPIKYHPSRQRNLVDLSSGIDAKSLATFQLEWATPATSVIGTNGAIDTTTVLKAAVGRWYGIPDAIRKSAFAIPTFTEEKFTISATSTDLGTTYNLPTQRWIKRTLIMLTDNGTALTTDKKDDTRITQLGIIKGGSTRIMSLPWRTARLDTCMEYNWKIDTGSAQAGVVTADLANTGIVVIEWSRFTGFAWGLPPIQNLGDVQLGFTIGTGNGVYSVYQQAYQNVPAWESARMVNDPLASYVMSP